MGSDSDANEMNCNVNLYAEHRVFDDNVDRLNVNDVGVGNVKDVHTANVNIVDSVLKTGSDWTVEPVELGTDQITSLVQ